MAFDWGGALSTAAIGGGGLGIMKGLFGGDNDKANAMKRLLEQMQREQAMQNVKSEGYLTQGLGSLNTNYDAAINNVARTGAASRTAAIGAGQRAGAAAGQSLAGRGLYNTSALNAAQAMNTGATSQALASIDQAVANSKAGLQSQKGNAVNAAYQGLSGLSERYGQARMQPLGLAYQAAASAPTQWDQMMQLLQAGGQIGGMMMGVPSFGGGGGGGGGYNGYNGTDRPG